MDALLEMFACAQISHIAKEPVGSGFHNFDGNSKKFKWKRSWSCTQKGKFFAPSFCNWSEGESFEKSKSHKAIDGKTWWNIWWKKRNCKNSLSIDCLTLNSHKNKQSDVLWNVCLSSRKKKMCHLWLHFAVVTFLLVLGVPIAECSLLRPTSNEFMNLASTCSSDVKEQVSVKSFDNKQSCCRLFLSWNRQTRCKKLSEFAWFDQKMRESQILIFLHFAHWCCWRRVGVHESPICVTFFQFALQWTCCHQTPSFVTFWLFFGGRSACVSGSFSNHAKFACNPCTPLCCNPFSFVLAWHLRQRPRFSCHLRQRLQCRCRNATPLFSPFCQPQCLAQCCLLPPVPASLLFQVSSHVLSSSCQHGSCC